MRSETGVKCRDGLIHAVITLVITVCMFIVGAAGFFLYDYAVHRHPFPTQFPIHCPPGNASGDTRR